MPTDKIARLRELYKESANGPFRVRTKDARRNIAFEGSETIEGPSGTPIACVTGLVWKPKCAKSVRPTAEYLVACMNTNHYLLAIAEAAKKVDDAVNIGVCGCSIDRAKEIDSAVCELRSALTAFEEAQ